MNMPTDTVERDYDALLDESLAWAVAAGDIVNFRLLFLPASPFREESPEDASSPKYDYLFTDTEKSPEYREALALVHTPEIRAYVREQLQRKGPPRLPWRLVMALGDNALRLGKYTAAAQAYELLRIRRRIQELALDKADERLKQGDLDAAVRGYSIALGLQYDYGAFPEPLPAVPDYHERAPAMHATYPVTLEQAPAWQEDSALCKAAVHYLLPYTEFSGHFETVEPDTLRAFTAALIRSLDQDWEAFAAAFRAAMKYAAAHEELFNKLNSYSADALDILSEELVAPALLEELRQIPALLAGAPGKNHEWWHYIKVMAYQHPGAALFVSRQRLSAKEEIIIPRVRKDSLLVRELGLTG